MGFDEAQQILAHRHDERQAIIAKANALSHVAKQLPSSNTKALPTSEIEPADPALEIEADLSKAKQLVSEIASTRKELDALGEELREAEEFRSKLLKFGAIGVGILLLLIILSSAG